MYKELPPMAQAEQEIPEAFYEVGFPQTLIAYGIINFGMFLANKEVLKMESLSYHLISVGIFLLCNLGDYYSTYKCFQQNENAVNLGINTGYEEANPLISSIKSPREFLTSKRTIGTTILGAGVSSIDLGFGVGYSIMKIHAALSNSKKATRMERAVAIVKEREMAQIESSG